MTALRITDATDRAGIEAAIVALRAKAKRLPAHWVDEQREISDEVDALVDRWLVASS